MRSIITAAVSIVSIIAAFSSGILILYIERRGLILIDNAGVEQLFLVIGVFAAVFAGFSAIYMNQMLLRKRMRARAKRVFIVYAQPDVEEAKRIAALLREGGFEPWLDVEQIKAGELWKEEIDQALSQSAIAVIVLTKKFNESEVASSELKKIVGRMGPSGYREGYIIPIRFDSSEIPPIISNIQYVDMSRPDADEYILESAGKALRRMLDA